MPKPHFVVVSYYLNYNGDAIRIEKILNKDLRKISWIKVKVDVTQ